MNKIQYSLANNKVCGVLDNRNFSLNIEGILKIEEGEFRVFKKVFSLFSSNIFSKQNILNSGTFYPKNTPYMTYKAIHKECHDLDCFIQNRNNIYMIYIYNFGL